MGKRAGSISPAVASKALKVDPLADKCEKVVAALRRSRDLPPVVCEMLGDMLPFGAKACLEERHEFQHGVLGMASKEMARLQESLAVAVAEAEGRLDELGPEKEAREAEVAELSAAQEKREAVTHTRKHALAGDAIAFRGAKESLAEAEGKLEAGEQAVVAARGKQEELGAALKDGLAPLKEGSLAPEDAPAAAAELVPRLQRLFELEESLVTAVPKVLGKEPAARGPFDTMALAQLEDLAHKAAGTLAGETEAAEAARSQQVVAVQSAREALGLARDRQRASAETFTAARREEEEGATALQAAKQALKLLAPERRRRERTLGQARAAVQELEEGPAATLRELCGELAATAAAEAGAPDAEATPVEEAAAVVAA